MKKTIIQFVMMIGIVVGCTAFAHAQYGQYYRVNIPFDFSIGKKQYPAGLYNLELRGFETKYFVLRDAEGRNSHAVGLSVGQLNSAAMSGLDFYRLADRYFLASVYASGLTASVPRKQIEAGIAMNRNMSTVKLSASKGH